jgi:acetaldehyde dehydrogenase/alcohol dehydrogenase
MFDMDYVARITHYLDLIGIVHATFYHVHSAPTIEAVQQGMRELRSFKPDCIIAVGGGSPMDVGKVGEEGKGMGERAKGRVSEEARRKER